MWAVLLKLVTPKDVLYAAIAVCLLAFGLHYKSLEKQVREAAQVSAAAQIQVKAVDKTAQITETQSALIYKEIVRIPDVPDIGIVCRNTSRSALSAPGPVAGANVGEQPTDRGAGPSYDPSGAALTRAKVADAEIAYLQRRVHELEAQMNGAP